MNPSLLGRYVGLLHYENSYILLLLDTHNSRLLTITWMRCRETARNDEKWACMNENDDDFKGPIFTTAKTL